MWTLSVWTNAEALKAFVASQIHQTAVEAGTPAMKTVRFARFEHPADALPISWDQAKELLEQHARPAGDSYYTEPSY